MARQSSTIQVIGKVGNLVGMRNSAARKAGSVFARSYVSEISNPRTYQQAVQRAKLKPANAFYKAFENILNHAYLPSQGIGKNHNRFNKLALSLDAIPFVFKNENKVPFNVPYQISEGSLGLDALTRPTYGQYAATGFESEYTVRFDGLSAFGVDPDYSGYVGGFSQELIAANPLLRDGDELTILAVLCDIEQPAATFAASVSIVLNVNDQSTTMADIFGDNAAIYWNPVNIGSSENTNYRFGVASEKYGLLAAGLIISRKTSNSWVYTNSFMGMTPYAIDGFDYDVEAIVESYMDSTANRVSDKVLQQANRVQSGRVVFTGTIAAVPFSASRLAGEAAGGTVSVASVAAAVYSDGTRRILLSDSGQLLTGAAAPFTPVTYTKNEVTSPLTVGLTDFDGGPVVSASSLGF